MAIRSCLIAASDVLLPKNAPWLDEFRNELTAFPLAVTTTRSMHSRSFSDGSRTESTNTGLRHHQPKSSADYKRRRTTDLRPDGATARQLTNRADCQWRDSLKSTLSRTEYRRDATAKIFAEISTCNIAKIDDEVYSDAVLE